MGCRVVLEANRIAPERVAGIVLVDGSRSGTGDPGAAEAADAQRRSAQAGYPPGRGKLFRQMFLESTPRDRAPCVARAVRSSAEIGAALWPRIGALGRRRTLDAALAAVRAPLLVIQTTMRQRASASAGRLKAGQSSPWLDLLKTKDCRASKSSRAAATFRSSRRPSASTA